MKNLKKLCLFIGTCFIVSQLPGQHLTAFTDYREHFHIFDHGKSKQVDHLKPQSFKIGGPYVLYISSQGHLNMYFNGEVSTLEKVTPSSYLATDYLAAYNFFSKLKVVYQGESIELSNRCTDFVVADSLIVFYDKNKEALNVFYNGDIMEVESGLIDGFPLQSWTSSDNIFAYITKRNMDFKIWHQGELKTILRNVEKTKFEAGRDIVAYTDLLEQNFKAFYKGNIYTLSDFIPQSFRTGDGFVAYIDDTGEFKVFSEGKINTISPSPPESYIAKDNILAFVEDNIFKAWNNGNTVEIEPYKPRTFDLDWNTIAYLDNSGRMFAYANGERKYISNELISSFQVYRDLIHIEVKNNRSIIYYKGKLYNDKNIPR